MLSHEREHSVLSMANYSEKSVVKESIFNTSVGPLGNASHCKGSNYFSFVPIRLF